MGAASKQRKKLLLEEMHELQRDAAEIRQQRDALLGVDVLNNSNDNSHEGSTRGHGAAAGDPLTDQHAGMGVGVSESAEDAALQRAISLSLAESQSRSQANRNTERGAEGNGPILERVGLVEAACLEGTERSASLAERSSSLSDDAKLSPKIGVVPETAESRREAAAVAAEKRQQKRQHTKFTSIGDDDLFDSELAEMNDFLMAMELQGDDDL
eukprot:267683-Prorocentrum_minimum.AAC.1